MRYIFFILFLILLACEDSQEDIFQQVYFEEPPSIEYPQDNLPSEARWNLGKKLFYEQMLSTDSTISCGSCHDPALAFADNRNLPTGVKNRIGNRNVPTLMNAAYHPYFTREGGVPTLEMQVLVPIQEHDEMDFNIVLAAERLKQIEAYNIMSQTAYNRDLDPFVITRAIANFERSFQSVTSKFDKYLNGGQEFSSAELRGMELFFSDRSQCSSCHSGFNFTSYEFANNGLYKEYDDEGRMKLTYLESDRSLFKIPSLRNVELTSPYMHDGSLSTLEEVIDHYNSGGEAHSNKSKKVGALNLNQNEKDDLLAFLKTLTDYDALNDEKFYEE